MGVFSPSGSSGFGGSSTTNSINLPTIALVPVALASTEYSYALPAGTKFFRLKTIEGSKLQLAFILGASGTTYITIFPGSTYESPQFPLASSLTVYFQCYKASQTVEIESWV